MTNIKWRTAPGTQLSPQAYLTLLTFTSLHVTDVIFSTNWRWECERDVAGEWLNLLNALWNCVYQGVPRERAMSQKVNFMSVCVRGEKKQVNVRAWGHLPPWVWNQRLQCILSLNTCLLYAVHLATCGPPTHVHPPVYLAYVYVHVWKYKQGKETCKLHHKDTIRKIQPVGNCRTNGSLFSSK